MRYDIKIKDVVFPEYKTKSKKKKLKIEAKRKIVNHEKMYVITLLVNKKNEYFKDLSSARILASKKQKDFLVLIEGESRTTKNTISKIFKNRFIDNSEIEVDDSAITVINELADDKYSMYSTMYQLKYWIQDILRYRKNNAVSRTPIIPDDKVYECPSELPEGLLDYIKDEIIAKDRTLVYKKGNVRGICAYCGESVRASAPLRFTQSSVVRCPNCYEPVTCVLENGGLWRADYFDNVVIAQKGKEDGVWFRQFHIIRDNSARYENLESWVSECARYLITHGKVAMWKSYHKFSSWIGRCEEVKLQDWERSKKFYVYDGQYTFYDYGVREELESSCLQYADIPGYLTEYQHQNVIMYAAQFARYPVMEFLHKAGYHNLVSEKVRGGNYEYGKAIRWSGKKLKDCFQFPIFYLKEAQPINWTLKRVSLINSIWEKISPQDVTDVFETEASEATLKTILKYTSISKAIKYLKKQKNDFGIYSDYIEECEELKLDLSKEEILFPKSLIQAHEANTKSIEYKKDPKAAERFAKVVKKLNKFTFEDDNYLIRPASDSAELKLEGEALNHCVYRYATRMSNGTTEIYLIRDKQNPDKPFYTLELQEKSILQCRTKSNISYELNPAVKEFVHKWYNNKILTR